MKYSNNFFMLKANAAVIHIQNGNWLYNTISLLENVLNLMFSKINTIKFINECCPLDLPRAITEYKCDIIVMISTVREWSIS
jgi:hypothetical protein